MDHGSEPRSRLSFVWLSQSEELKDYGLNKVVRNTLNIMDEAISSVQDV